MAQEIKDLEKIGPHFKTKDQSTNITRATYMRLSSKKISTFPSGLVMLVDLLSLDLSNNMLSEVEIGASRLVKLTHLNISNNGFTELPQVIYALTNLVELLIFDNAITELADGLCNLPRLSSLMLESRGMYTVGKLPANITRLPCYKNTSTPFSGMKYSIAETLKRIVDKKPPEQKYIRPIVGLRAAAAQPAAMPPYAKLLVNENTTLQNIFDLRPILAFGDPERTNIESISYIQLNQKRMLQLPNSISRLTNLRSLDISDNYLSGLPEECSRLTKISKLNMSSNQFTELPPILYSMVNLEELILFSNPIPEIPDWIGRFCQLKVLALEFQGNQSVKRAHVSITSIPAWTNKSKPYAGMKRSIAESLQKIEQYKTEAQPPSTRPSRRGTVGAGVAGAAGVDDNDADEEGDDLMGRIEGVGNEQFIRVLKRRLNEAEAQLRTYRRKEQEEQAARDNIAREEVAQQIQLQGRLEENNVLVGRKTEYFNRAFHDEQDEAFAVTNATHTKYFGAGEIVKYQKNMLQWSEIQIEYLDGKIVKVSDDFIKPQLKGVAYFSVADEIRKRKRIQMGQSNPLVVDIDFTIETSDDLHNVIACCVGGDMCGFCFKKPTDPKYLPCAHMFCVDCLKSALEFSGEPPYSCPLCKSKVYLDAITVENLPLSLAAVLKENESLGQNDAEPEQEEAENADSTDRRGGMPHHESRFSFADFPAYEDLIITPNEQTYRCLSHPGFDVEIFCRDCDIQELKCRECARLDKQKNKKHRHIDHQDPVKFAHEYLERLKRKSLDIKKEIDSNDSHLVRCEESFERVNKEMDEFYEQAFKKLEDLKKASKDQLYSTSKLLCDSLDKKSKSLHFDLMRTNIAIASLEVSTKPVTGEQQKPTPSFFELGNALRFAKQILTTKSSKGHTDIDLSFSSATLQPNLPLQLLEELESLAKSFTCGISCDTKTASTRTDAGQGTSANSVGTATQQDSDDEGDDQRRPTLPIGRGDSATRKDEVIDDQAFIAKIRQICTPEQSHEMEGLQAPRGICIHPQTRQIYVADEDQNLVQVYTQDMQPCFSFVTGLPGTRVFHGPRSIAISQQGHIAVADCEAHCVKLFVERDDSVILAKVITNGPNNGEQPLSRPYAVAFAPNGDLFVADSNNGCVHKYSHTGDYRAAIPGNGKFPSMVVSLAVLAESNRLAILCAGQERVFLQDLDGNPVSEIALQQPTSREGFTHVFAARAGVFGVCEYKSGIVWFYSEAGGLLHALSLDECRAAAVDTDGSLVAVGLQPMQVLRY